MTRNDTESWDYTSDVGMSEYLCSSYSSLESVSMNMSTYLGISLLLTVEMGCFPIKCDLIEF